MEDSLHTLHLTCDKIDALILFDKNNASRHAFLSYCKDKVHPTFYLSSRNKKKVEEMQFPSLLILITIGDKPVRIHIYFINDR